MKWGLLVIAVASLGSLLRLWAYLRSGQRDVSLSWLAEDERLRDRYSGYEGVSYRGKFKR